MSLINQSPPGLLIIDKAWGSKAPHVLQPPWGLLTRVWFAC